jgi:tRNA(Ile)-lysidine synthase
VRNEPQLHRSKTKFVGVRRLTRNLQDLFIYQNIYLAYSGGIDSHVLLHLCASDEQFKNKITAVYVDHGLQKEAEGWGKHCEQVCDDLNVKFLSLKTNAQAAPGESPEEAARNARYLSLKPLLSKGDVLLLAQHAEDQLETVLLQLFRGSGIKGLSGMPASMSFGEGVLMRPLLDIPKAAIIEYAQSHNLKWVEDPSNQRSSFDRNFLRNDIIPQLKQRWPSIDHTVSRSARHCADAQSLIDLQADDLLNAVFNAADESLNIGLLFSYALPEQKLVIRQWFKNLGLKMPSLDIVQQILLQVAQARKDANPVVLTQGYNIRRYRNHLFCLKPQKINLNDEFVWPKQDRQIKISDEVTYKIQESSNGIAFDVWQRARVTVKFRSGGETLQLPGRQSHQTLKNLLQEVGIPPWEREVMPLFYLDDNLAAVGERWISSEFYSKGLKPCFRIIRHKINPKGNDDTPDVD